MFRPKRLACSFCGKSAEDVAKLVAGPKVYICDNCVAIASRIMNDDEPHHVISRSNHRGFLGRLLSRLHKLLRAGRVHRFVCVRPLL